MGALIIILGVAFLDIMAIADVLRARPENSWAYIVLIVILPIFGYSVWYVRKSLFYSFAAENCFKYQTTSDNFLPFSDSFREMLVSCNSTYVMTESYKKLNGNPYKGNVADSERILTEMADVYSGVLSQLSFYLTKKECIVAILLSLEISNGNISSLLFVSKTTVRTYKTKIKKKLPPCLSDILFEYDKAVG